MWVLFGSHWKLPLRVFWHDHVVAEVRVGGGVTLLRRQREVGCSHLSRICFRRDGENFFVYRHVLEKTAAASCVADPEDLVEWTPDREVKQESDYKPPSEFVAKYCQSSYATIRDPLMADITWISFCKWMLHWMMVENKTVDILFATLVPLQARVNWQQTLAKLEMKHVPERRRFAAAMKAIIARGIPALAMSPYLLSFNGKYCDWTITVRTNEEWDKMAFRTDRARASRYNGACGYALMVEDQLKRQLPELLLCYEDFLEKAVRPAFKFFNRSRPRGFGWGAGGETKHVWFRPLPPLAPHGDGVSLFSHGHKEGGTENVLSEAEILRSLPDLQRHAKDLRNGYFTEGSGI